MKGLRQLTISTALAVLLAACATTAPVPPESWDGLALRQVSDSGALYVRPDLQERAFRAVVIEPLVVSTDKDWLPVRNVATGVAVAQHPVSSREIQYIEDTIDPEFRRIVAKELGARGYRIVDEPGDGALRVSAGLALVFIDSPGSGMGRLRSDDTATLVLDLSDPASGQLLARLVDTKQGGKMGMLESPNTVANNLVFRRAIKDWAGMLGDVLDSIGGVPGATDGARVLVANRPKPVR